MAMGFISDGEAGPWALLLREEGRMKECEPLDGSVAGSEIVGSGKAVS